jgi:hypothetical protein
LGDGLNGARSSGNIGNLHPLFLIADASIAVTQYGEGISPLFLMADTSIAAAKCYDTGVFPFTLKIEPTTSYLILLIL